MEEKSLTKIPAQGPRQRTQTAGRHSGAASRACGGSAGPHCAPRCAQESWENAGDKQARGQIQQPLLIKTINKAHTGNTTNSEAVFQNQALTPHSAVRC